MNIVFAHNFISNWIFKGPESSLISKINYANMTCDNNIFMNIGTLKSKNVTLPVQKNANKSYEYINRRYELR